MWEYIDAITLFIFALPVVGIAIWLFFSPRAKSCFSRSAADNEDAADSVDEHAAFLGSEMRDFHRQLQRSCDKVHPSSRQTQADSSTRSDDE